ncbi:shikimate dehydrogenase [Glycocaulis abyssi]|uniref:Shikimate dehydrogenase (NADP(+)) n=1 Tax=Glycocaulis abyssi TaxID=1433403 RepID=A0ABV9NDW1_9PROT
MGGVRKAGVIGWPVGHSLSPAMMTAWLNDAGIEGEYSPVAAAPEDFADTIHRLREAGYAGVNVTLPHKEAALALADTASDAARAAGAANVLVFEKARIHADNTDITGIRATLDEGGWQAETGPAVLIGAGGAARAALYVLKAAGVPARIVNRSPDRAAELARSMGCAAEIHGLDAAPRALEGARLVINATSLGMKGQPALALPLDILPADALVFDMVYVPLETGLLKQARSRALRTVGGLSMLIGQARPAFEAFFGKPVPARTPVRAMLEAALEGRP